MSETDEECLSNAAGSLRPPPTHRRDHRHDGAAGGGPLQPGVASGWSMCGVAAQTGPPVVSVICVPVKLHSGASSSPRLLRTSQEPRSAKHRSCAGRQRQHYSPPALHPVISSSPPSSSSAHGDNKPASALPGQRFFKGKALRMRGLAAPPCWIARSTLPALPSSWLLSVARACQVCWGPDSVRQV